MPENRTKAGKFAPGCSGNPGGRPKKTDAQRAAQEAIQALASDAVELVSAIMRDETAPLPVRLKAAEMVLDRSIGKPISCTDARKQLENEEWEDKINRHLGF